MEQVTDRFNQLVDAELVLKSLIESSCQKELDLFQKKAQGLTKIRKEIDQRKTELSGIMDSISQLSLPEDASARELVDRSVSNRYQKELSQLWGILVRYKPYDHKTLLEADVERKKSQTKGAAV